MSLVSEALRKARQEAAAREARTRGALPATVGASPRARRWTWGAVALLIAVAGASGGALTWWILDHGTGAEAPTTTPLQAAAKHSGPAPAATEVPATLTGRSGQAAPEAPVSTTPVPASAPTATAAVHPAAGRLAETPAQTVGTNSPNTTVEGSHEAATAAPGRGEPKDRVFVIDADLGYAKLHLDWLVYKPGASFGRINGQEIVEGSNVDGFEVEKIGPESVTLRDRRGIVVLRVR